MKHSQNSFSGLMSLGNEFRRAASLSIISKPLRGMSMSQMWTLQYICDYEEEGIFQKDIESFLKIRRSSVSSLLRKLEKSGLLLRVPVPEDARLKRLLLTPEGRELCHEVEKINEQIAQNLTKILSEEEMNTFTSILKKIEVNMDALTAELNEDRKQERK